jgi:hypothetical protein
MQDSQIPPHGIRGRTSEAAPDAPGSSAYVQREFDDDLRGSILAHGLLRLGCDTCKKEGLRPCRCKRRGFCPSGAGRRMVQMAAPLGAQVPRAPPWCGPRQWAATARVG